MKWNAIIALSIKIYCFLLPESDEKHHFAVCLMNAFWKLHSCQPVNLVLSPLSSIGKVTKRECKICKGLKFKHVHCTCAAAVFTSLEKSYQSFLKECCFAE